MNKTIAFWSIGLLFSVVACGLGGEDTYDRSNSALEGESTGGRQNRRSEGAGCECAKTTSPSTGGSASTGGSLATGGSSEPQVILLNLKPGSKNILCHDTDKATGGSSSCVCATGGAASTGGSPSTGGTPQTSTDNCYKDETGEVYCDIG